MDTDGGRWSGVGGPLLTARDPSPLSFPHGPDYQGTPSFPTPKQIPSSHSFLLKHNPDHRWLVRSPDDHDAAASLVGSGEERMGRVGGGA